MYSMKTKIIQPTDEQLSNIQSYFGVSKQEARSIDYTFQRLRTNE